MIARHFSLAATESGYAVSVQTMQDTNNEAKLVTLNMIEFPTNIDFNYLIYKIMNVQIHLICNPSGSIGLHFRQHQPATLHASNAQLCLTVTRLLSRLTL